jgi:hypothetical protein
VAPEEAVQVTLDMSDIPYAPPADYTRGVVARLARLRKQIAAWFWVEGLARVFWLMLAIGAADLALDWLFRMDRPQRAVMLVLMLAALAWAVHRWLVRPLSATTSDDALALQIESANRSLGQSLITALQLARVADGPSPGASPILVRQAIVSGLQRSQEVSFADVLDRPRSARNALWLLAASLLLSLVFVGILVAAPLQTWFSRNILLTNATWPQNTYLVVERVGKDGRVVFPRGDDWTQVVSVTPESLVVPDVIYLDFRHSRGRAPVTMKKTRERQFEATFVSVIESFEFRARGGDAVTEWFRAELVEPPALTELKLVVTSPRYTGGQPEELAPGRGPYYVLKGSSLSLAATANKPLVRAELLIDGKRRRLGFADALRFEHIGGEIESAELVPGQYTIELEDTLGLTSRRPTTFGLRTRVDREPRVRVRLIGISGMVLSRAKIPFGCRLTDDFGLTSAAISYRWKGDDAAQPEGQGLLNLHHVGQASSLPEISFDDTIELAPLNIPAGSGMSFRFEAADNDDISGPNIGRSSEFLLRIVTEEELRTDLLRREKEQRQEFERLIKNQDELVTDSRVLAAAIKSQSDLTAEQKDQLAQYLKRQKLVGQSTAAIAERLAGIVIEVQNNRLEEAGGRLQSRLTKEIVEPMQAVADEFIPLAATALEKTRRHAASAADREMALAEAIARQTEAAAQMKEILDHMVKAEGFQEAVNLLYEIQKAQTEVNDQTNKARQERIRRILEGGKEPTPR